MDEILRKNVKRSSQTGFTLVELLVVISIVGLLAGLVTVGVPRAMEAGKKAKVKGELTAIVAAVKAYKQEYGKWPGSTFTSDTTYQGGQSMQLLAALSGTNSSAVENPKSVRFLEGAQSNGTMLDPWETQYLVLVDSDDSNSLDYQSKTAAISVLAVSFGKDKKQDATPGSGDDIFSTDLK